MGPAVQLLAAGSLPGSDRAGFRFADRRELPERGDQRPVARDEQGADGRREDDRPAPERLAETDGSGG